MNSIPVTAKIVTKLFCAFLYHSILGSLSPYANFLLDTYDKVMKEFI